VDLAEWYGRVNRAILADGCAEQFERVSLCRGGGDDEFEALSAARSWFRVRGGEMVEQRGEVVDCLMVVSAFP